MVENICNSYRVFHKELLVSCCQVHHCEGDCSGGEQRIYLHCKDKICEFSLFAETQLQQSTNGWKIAKFLLVSPIQCHELTASRTS